MMSKRCAEGTYERIHFGTLVGKPVQWRVGTFAAYASRYSG
jgi:hypothetical protein